jgi:hypothetical protein
VPDFCPLFFLNKYTNNTRITKNKFRKGKGNSTGKWRRQLRTDGKHTSIGQWNRPTGNDCPLVYFNTRWYFLSSSCTRKAVTSGNSIISCWNFFNFHIHKWEMDRRHDEEGNMVAIYEASMNGCVSTLNTLIQRDALILNKVSLTSFNETPLHIAALLGHLEFSRVLLNKKPKLTEEVDSLGRTPLHLASAEGHVHWDCKSIIASKYRCLLSFWSGWENSSSIT